MEVTTILTQGEGEPRREHPIEESLEHGRERAPFAAVHHGLTCPLRIGIEQRAAQAVAAGMGKNQQAAHDAVAQSEGE